MKRHTLAAVLLALLSVSGCALEESEGPAPTSNCCAERTCSSYRIGDITVYCGTALTQAEDAGPANR